MCAGELAVGRKVIGATMSQIVEIAEARLRDIPAYRPGRPSPGLPSGKLSSNESAFGPAPAVRAAVMAAVANVNHYPEQRRALDLLAIDAHVHPSQIILTNGSDELCYLIANVFLGPGRVAVLGDPCYQIDATASRLSGATLRLVPLRDGGHDLENMAKAAANASVVWLPSPHNPTGVMVDTGELERFLDRVPAGCLVVLDEAYRAFADPEFQPRVVELLAAHSNLVIQRTLSKDWALAGIRAGYAIASTELVEWLARARSPFSMNSLALAAIEAGRNGEGWRNMAVARVREQRSLLEQELTRLSIDYIPSQANFVTVRLDARVVAPALEKSGLVVRAGEDLGMPGWVRISVGWAPPMAELRMVLRTIASSTRSAGSCNDVANLEVSIADSDESSER